MMTRCILGFGRIDLEPGEEGVFAVEPTQDFTVDNFYFGGDTQCFEILQVSAGGNTVPIIRGLMTSSGGSDGVPIRLFVKVCQKIEVSLRNVSRVRATLQGAVGGTIVGKDIRDMTDEISRLRSAKSYFQGDK